MSHDLKTLDAQIQAAASALNQLKEQRAIVARHQHLTEIADRLRNIIKSDDRKTQFLWNPRCIDRSESLADLLGALNDKLRWDACNPKWGSEEKEIYSLLQHFTVAETVTLEYRYESDYISYEALRSGDYTLGFEDWDFRNAKDAPKIGEEGERMLQHYIVEPDDEITEETADDRHIDSEGYIALYTCEHTAFLLHLTSP